MGLIVTDSSRKALMEIEDCELDMAWGYGEDSSDGENDFTLTLHDRLESDMILGLNSLVYQDGSDAGGMVRAIKTEVVDGVTTVSYSGPSWTGLLKQRVIKPDSGKSHWSVSGDASTVLGQVINRVGLQSLFSVDSSARAGVNVSRDFRYDDAYTGIRLMLADAGLKLVMRWEGAKLLLSAQPIVEYTDEVDSDLMDFTLVRDYGSVNHLIGLGKGTGASRVVSEWYADRNGNVSQTQSLNGLDENVEIYDYSNAEAADLAKESKKRLQELQSQGDVDVTVHHAHVFDVGDRVTGSNRATGLSVTATVCKKILTLSGGVLTVDYEVGDKTTENPSQYD